MAISVRNQTSCLAKFRKFGPFCAAIRVQHINDRQADKTENHRKGGDSSDRDAKPQNHRVFIPRTIEGLGPHHQAVSVTKPITTIPTDVTDITGTVTKPKDKRPCNRSFSDLGLKLGDAITNPGLAKPFEDLITKYADCFALTVSSQAANWPSVLSS
jgi:hypothetical protein